MLTVGDVFTQTQKVTLAHIPAPHFVCVETGAEKFEGLKSIIKTYSLDTRRVLVVGDKINKEIRYGNQLRCTTVRTMFGGKHDNNHPQEPNEIPDFTVASVDSLVLLLASWKILKT